MLNIKSITNALCYMALSLAIMPSLASASDDYLILPCNACSDYSMQKKAETLSSYGSKKVHVYNSVTGVLKAWHVERDYENDVNRSLATAADAIVTTRANAAFLAATNISEPQVPETIATSAWEYSRFTAIQNETRDWLHTNSGWSTEALTAAQTLADLYRGTFQSQWFTVHLKNGGKVVFKSTGYQVDGNGIRLHLVFDYAEDKDGNRVAQTKAELNKPYRLSGGDRGTADAFANTAIHIFGVSSVSFSGSPGSGSSSSFTCSSTENGLHCVKIN